MKNLRVGLKIALGCSLLTGLLAVTGCTQTGDRSTGANSTTPAETTKVESAKPETSKTETTKAETTKTKTTQLADAKPAAGKLAGQYCYGSNDENLTAEAQINIKDSQVTGNLKGLIHNQKAGYFTSYSQTATGELTENQAKMQVNTDIENDKQKSQETWTITDRQLKTQRETLEQMDCSELGKLAERARQVMKTAAPKPADAPQADASRIEFARGSSAATVKGAIVRGEQKSYVLNAAKGQTMKMKVTSPEGNAVFELIGPDGKSLKQEESNTSQVLPATGDYRLVVGSMRGNASYSLTVSVE